MKKPPQKVGDSAEFKKIGNFFQLFWKQLKINFWLVKKVEFRIGGCATRNSNLESYLIHMLYALENQSKLFQGAGISMFYCVRQVLLRFSLSIKFCLSAVFPINSKCQNVLF